MTQSASQMNRASHLSNILLNTGCCGREIRVHVRHQDRYITPTCCVKESKNNFPSRDPLGWFFLMNKFQVYEAIFEFTWSVMHMAFRVYGKNRWCNATFLFPIRTLQYSYLLSDSNIILCSNRARQ